MKNILPIAAVGLLIWYFMKNKKAKQTVANMLPGSASINEAKAQFVRLADGSPEKKSFKKSNKCCCNG